MDVHTCSDLQRLSKAQLQQNFGEKTGNFLYMYCHCKDDRMLNVSHQRKSVSAEVNYGMIHQSGRSCSILEPVGRRGLITTEEVQAEGPVHYSETDGEDLRQTLEAHTLKCMFFFFSIPVCAITASGKMGVKCCKLYHPVC
jgi:hypothetical protein